MKTATDSYTATERLRRAGQERGSHPSAESERSYQEELTHFNSVLDESRSAHAVFEILRGQISDAKLDELIEGARTAQEEAGTKIIPLTRLLSNPGPASVATIENALCAYHEVLKVLRSKLIAINKRIEELLIGAVTS